VTTGDRLPPVAEQSGESSKWYTAIQISSSPDADLYECRIPYTDSVVLEKPQTVL
jgi:hypothetical protein